jgi:hypothetical protein
VAFFLHPGPLHWRTGHNLIERIAGASDYQVAVETYRAAV